MKKIAKLFHLQMLKPVLYKVIAKFLIGLTAILLWNRFINKNHYYSVVEFGFFIIGIFFVVFAWINYLKMDGMKIHGLDAVKAAGAKTKKAIFGLKDMIDFVEEPAVSFDDLSEEEQGAVAFGSNCIAALLFLMPSLAVMLF